MKQRMVHRITVLLMFISLLMSGCSSDSGGETGTGITAEITVVGPITGFGSIYVNDIRFDTDDANILFDEAEATEDKLAVGMIVTVKGTVNIDDQTIGSAINIIAETEVKGLVSSNTSNQNGTHTLVVMGSVVNVAADTSYVSEVDDMTLDDINSQTVVEVSGYSDNAGNIRATFLRVVRNDGDAGEIKVKGVITNLDLSGNQFKVADLTVIIDDDTEFSGVKKQDLRDGLFVEVEGESFSLSNNDDGQKIIASEIELESIDEEEGEEVKVKGDVLNVDNLGDGVDGEFDFSMGRLIRVNDKTRYEDGNKSNIVVGAILKIKGEIAEDGATIAEEIEFQEQDEADDDD
ncbi:MAG: hypothetical protein GXP08_13545 [Gammaproteobacteria bacterium]|nr:hypothetical protein [Gammaproteobacteria bacterium]